jgi:hypothetical protein
MRTAIGQTNEGSNMTVLMEDYLILDIFSSTCDNMDRKVLCLEVGTGWITGVIQDKIFCSINFHALKHAVESGIVKAIGN